MPAVKNSKTKTNRGLYVHNPVTTTKASTATRTGNIRTIITRHEHDPEPGPSGSTFDHMGESIPMPDDMEIDGDRGLSDLTPEPTYEVPTASISGIDVKMPAKRYVNSDHPLLTWIGYRDRYLDATLRLEGRGRFVGQGCASCGDMDPTYRCLDCHGRRVVCKECLVHDHKDEPLHIVELWSDNRFQRISLASLGLRVQLGHSARSACQFPQAARKDFQVLHTNGVHTVQLDFCGCDPSYEPFDQILDAAWFPATPLNPHTCSTFAVLRQFHTLNLQGKVSAFDFYKSLVLLTDATGLIKIPDRLPSFMVMVREWRHLKTVKRAGRGHDPSGIAGTPRGGLAIDCRACPQPKINLPDGWENAPPAIAWLYRLMLSEDANFRLKSRLRSSDEKDPSLGPGLAYLMHSDEYLRHLAKYVDQDEISHCVGFAALWLANNRKSKGLRATGVGSVSCARHQVFRPTGTGDLQKGEKYCNMDMIFMSSIAGVYMVLLLLCYDIACQFSINFWKRLEKLPDHLQFINKPLIQWNVPKFHLPPHKPACHGPFSLNYTPGAGRTDGEGVERNWAFLNGAAPSTSQMGPGARHDTLDDFMGFWNYRKTVDSGETLLRNLVIAIPEAIIHRQAFSHFTDGLRKEHMQDLRSWEEMVTTWEADKAKPDPYLVEEDSVTVNEIRRQLAEEEHQKVESGAASLDVTPASFIISGLAIEETQLSIRPIAAKKNRSPAQEADLQQKRTALLRKIQRFREVQPMYMPGLPLPDDYTATPEEMNIQLPSSLNALQRSAICMAELPKMEDRLREAHAAEALTDLRRQLRTRTFAKKFRDENATSQGAYTRMRALQDHIAKKILSARDRYHAARNALLKLRGPGEWEGTFKVLKAADIRGVNESMVTEEEGRARNWAQVVTGAGEDSDGEATLRTYSTLRLQTGETSRSVSWIWYNVTAAEIQKDADGSLHDGIRLEWLKARARAERWREEVLLLEEEMRRVLEYCTWKARWWEHQSSRRNTGSTILDEGVRAYAMEQAHIEKSRVELWGARWAPVRQRAKEALRDKLDSISGELCGQFDMINVVLEGDEGDEEDDWSD